MTAAFGLQPRRMARADCRPRSIAVAIGLAGMYALSRIGPLMLTVLSPAPVVFILIFLLLSPVSSLVLPGDEVEASSVTVPGDAPV